MNKTRIFGGLFLIIMMSVALPLKAELEIPDLSIELTRVDPRVAAADFIATDMDETAYSLKDFRGQVVLLNFWATWCPPCRREMPAMEQLYQELKDEGFSVIAINQWESPDHVFAYTGQLDVFPTFPILFDAESTIAEDYGVKGLPKSFVIDQQGRIVYSAIGGRDFSHPKIVEQLRALLAESE